MESGATRFGAEAGEGRVDPVTLMILRALAGERGKVDIGGRLYTFTGVTTFHLLDHQTGQTIVCGDTITLLRTILDLLRDARAGNYRRHFSAAPSG